MPVGKPDVADLTPAHTGENPQPLKNIIAYFSVKFNRKDRANALKVDSDNR